MYKFCNRQGCTEIIQEGSRYCQKHIKDASIRHKEYDKYRRNKEAQAFYKSQQWIRMSGYIIAKYNNMDLYAYYEYKHVTKAELVHHIVELTDDWNLRLDIENLFPLTRSNHNVIHSLYEKDKTKTQEMLRQIIRRYNVEFA